MSMDAAESTINFLSSGLTVEVDAVAHCIFGLKNVSSFSRYVPRFFYNLLTHCQTAFIAPSSARSVWLGFEVLPG